MATIKFDGLDSIVAALENLTDNSREACKRAVWEGGNVVGNRIRSALNGIPVQDYYVPEGTKRYGISQEDKDEIIAGFGLAKMEASSNINTRAGFKTGAAGKMRKVESGTSYLKKHPTIRPAINGATEAAETVMEAKLEEEIFKLYMGV